MANNKNNDYNCNRPAASQLTADPKLPRQLPLRRRIADRPSLHSPAPLSKTISCPMPLATVFSIPPSPMCRGSGSDMAMGVLLASPP